MTRIKALKKNFRMEKKAGRTVNGWVSERERRIESFSAGSYAFHVPHSLLVS